MVLTYLSQQKARNEIIKSEENKIPLKEQKELTKIEKEALEICRKFQHLTKNVVGINLTDDVDENNKHLEALYQMRNIMDQLREILPKHEVIDKKTGKVFGELYDNEYVENVMLSTNIRINFGIQHTEWHIKHIAKIK